MVTVTLHAILRTSKHKGSNQNSNMVKLGKFSQLGRGGDFKVAHVSAVTLGQLSHWGSCRTGAVVQLGQLSYWGSCRLGSCLPGQLSPGQLSVHQI